MRRAAVLLTLSFCSVLAMAMQKRASDSPALPSKAASSSYWTPERMAQAEPFPMPRAVHTGGASTKQPDESSMALLIDNDVDVASYWTPERMAEAEPFPLPLSRASVLPPPQLNATAAPYVVNVNVFPFTAQGKLFFTSNGKNYVCTAQYVAYTDVVLTAGHCVYDPKSKQWHSNWALALSFKNGNYPGSLISFKACRTLNGWKNSGNFLYDTASCKANTRSSVYMGADYSFPSSCTLTMSGYGSRYGANQVNYGESGSCYRTSSQMMQLRPGLGGGSSGGMWFNSNNQVLAVTSNGDDSDTYVNGCPLGKAEKDMMAASHND